MPVGASVHVTTAITAEVRSHRRIQLPAAVDRSVIGVGVLIAVAQVLLEVLSASSRS